MQGVEVWRAQRGWRMGTDNSKQQQKSRWEQFSDTIRALAPLIAAIATLLTAVVALRQLFPSPASTPGSTPQDELRPARATLAASSTPSTPPTATSISTPTMRAPASPTHSPSPSPTLFAFDAFDDGCVDPLRWHPIPPVEGNPPDRVDETNCWALSPIHRFSETGSELEFRATGQSFDGLQRIRRACTITDLEVIVSRFALTRIYQDRNASGYVGIVVDRPEAEGTSTTPVGVWLAGRLTANLMVPSFMMFANQEIEGLPDQPTQQVLKRLPSSEGIEQVALGFHIIGRQVYGSVDGQRYRLAGIEMASPYSFRIVFGTTSGSGLEAAIEEVHVGWDQARPGSSECPLP